MIAHSPDSPLVPTFGVVASLPSYVAEANQLALETPSALRVHLQPSSHKALRHERRPIVRELPIFNTQLSKTHRSSPIPARILPLVQSVPIRNERLIMDYSASIHETEDPAASPWGNTPGSSPQHDRTTFGSITGDAPVPAFPYTPQSSNGLGHGGEDSFPVSGVVTPAPAEQDEVASAAHPESEDLSQSAGFEGPPQPAAATDAQPEEPRKPPQPQFRLQAKITGLERTGKKDPILRFDVHVSCFNCFPFH
jgi:hypothetical protein